MAAVRGREALLPLSQTILHPVLGRSPTLGRMDRSTTPGMAHRRVGAAAAVAFLALLLLGAVHGRAAAADPGIPAANPAIPSQGIEPPPGRPMRPAPGEPHRGFEPGAGPRGGGGEPGFGGRGDGLPGGGDEGVAPAPSTGGSTT